eukprot:COSAG06_NODE_5014_length_3790_cov_618.530750_4_plen_127_part_00
MEAAAAAASRNSIPQQHPAAAAPAAAAGATFDVLRVCTHVFVVCVRACLSYVCVIREPMSIWADWLAPYLGKSLSDSTVKETLPPTWWDGGTAFDRTGWGQQEEEEEEDQKELAAESSPAEAGGRR